MIGMTGAATKKEYERLYIIHTQKEGTKAYKESELIENALEQEREGIEPHYIWYDYKTGERWGNRGWLVYSTWEDGCAVVYRRNDGKMIIVTGWQGDFLHE